RAAPLRRAAGGARHAGRRADPRDGGARVRVAGVDRAVRRPTASDPPSQGPPMKALFCLLVVAPAALAAQQSRDTVVLDPVVVTAGVHHNALGGAYDLANLATDNVDRIEVVRGPVRVLHGSDAVTGVVQVYTRDGRGAAHGSVGVGGGTYGSRAVDATVAGGAERAGYAFSVSRFASDGVYPVDNQYRNAVLSGRVRLRPDDRTDAALSLRYGDALYHFPTDGGGNLVSNNQHQLDRGPSLGLDVGRVVSARVEGRFTAAWRRDNYQYAIGPNGPADTTTFPYSSSDWVTREGLDARANVRLAQSDVLTVGTAFEREAMQGTTLAAARSRNGGAVYLQLATVRERAANFTVGARLD